MWKPFGLMLAPFEGYCHHVEHALHASVWRSFPALEVSSCCFDDVSLLGPVHIVLRRCLYAHTAGLDLYKMYSIRTKGDYVDLKVSAPPVPFKDLVSQTFEKRACDVFSLLS